MANIKKLIVALNKQIAFKAAASLGFMPADRKERMFIRAGVAVTWLPEGFPKPQSLSHYQDTSASKSLQPAALCFDTYRFRNTSEANDDYGRQYSYLKKLVLSEPTQIVCFLGESLGRLISLLLSFTTYQRMVFCLRLTITPIVRMVCLTP